MKTLLTLVTAMALLVGIAQIRDPKLWNFQPSGQLVATNAFASTAKSHVMAMREDGSITNVINLLVAAGTFCAVRGHAWGEHIHSTLEYAPDRIACRECKVCRLHQASYASDWK